MKKITKFASAVLIILMLWTVLPLNNVYAQDVVNISIGSDSANVGDEITITVSITSNVEIGGIRIFLSYDSNIVEAISGFEGGGGGTINWIDVDTFQSKSREIKFKVLKAGTTNIKVITDGDMSYATNTDEEKMKLVANTGTITGVAGPNLSSDNTLKSLSISPGVLSPAFSPNVTEYTTSVGADCEKLIVSAESNDSKATVSVSGTRMDPGSNVTTITVTAENGTKRVYTIRTTRDDQSAEEPEPNPDGPDTGTVQKVQVGDAKYSINNDFDAHPLPAGYEAIDYDYNGTALKAGQGVNTRLLLMYLENTDGKGVSGFYIYDSVAKTFTWFNEIGQPNITYVILPITDQMEKPDGFSLTEYTINDQKVSVLMGAKGDYCLFYGISSNGVTGWFCYDLKDKTVQAYFSQYNEEHSATAGEQTVNSQNVASGKDWLWKIAALVMTLLTLISVTAAALFAGKAAKNRRILVDALRGDMEQEEADSALEDEEDILRDDYEENTDEELEENEQEQRDLENTQRTDCLNTTPGKTEPSADEAEEEYEFLELFDIDNDK